jgi:hypothetical protein
VNQAVVETLTGAVLGALARGESATPAATTLLVRRYAETGRDDVGQALGLALAQAIDLAGAAGEDERQPGWLTMFLEAASVSDDDRVPQICEELAARLQRQWADLATIGDSAASLESCLAFGAGAPAVEELERVIGRTYTPGAGLAHSSRNPGESRGTLRDHVNAAGALITAYSITGRLPYSMLAEELIQFTRRTLNTNPEPGTGNLELFLVRCEFARVLIRLADLHRSDEYKEAAVIADCDYEAEAEKALSSLVEECDRHGSLAAIYGLAVIEWLVLK